MNKTHHDFWKNYDEYLTKNYIKNSFRPDIEGIQKDESPDFTGDDIGLEIVAATSPVKNKLSNLFKKFNGKPLNDIPEKLLENSGFYKANMYQAEGGEPFYFIKSETDGELMLYKPKNGELILGGLIEFLPSDDFSSDLIVTKINDKLAKLNSNYHKFKSNLLGVYVDYALIPETKETREEMAKRYKDLLKSKILSKLERSYVDLFEHIYICFLDVVYQYILKTDSLSYRILENDDILTICNESLNEVNDL